MSIATIIGYVDSTRPDEERYPWLYSSCWCEGPQNGEPYCPCKMEQLKKENITNKSATKEEI